MAFCPMIMIYFWNSCTYIRERGGNLSFTQVLCLNNSMPLQGGWTPKKIYRV